MSDYVFAHLWQPGFPRGAGLEMTAVSYLELLPHYLVPL